jgi:hypothetical protein
VALLRLVLADCLRQGGLRSTAAWASAIGLADISNVALLNRLRGCGDWLAALVGGLLAAEARAASRGRLVRLIDATAVPKPGAAARRGNGVWRIHSAFNLPAERFAFFEVSEEKGGERLDRIPVEPGEIRIADRAYMQPERIATILAAGGDVVVRAGWRNAAWLGARGEPVDLIAVLCDNAEHGLIDRPIWVCRRGDAPPLPLHLVAVASGRRQEGAAGRRSGPPQGTARGAKGRAPNLSGDPGSGRLGDPCHLLPPKAFATADILALYRLRWRIDICQA